MDASDNNYIDFLRIYFPDTAKTFDMYSSMSPKGNTPEELKKSTEEIEAKIRTTLNNAKCVDDYTAYQKIPLGIRSRYSGTKVPEDIMEAARRDELITLREMERDSSIQRVEDARDAVNEKYGIPKGIDIPSAITTGAALAVFASAFAAGYSRTSSAELAMQRQNRDGLLAQKVGILANPNISESEKEKMLAEWFKKWIDSRKDTITTIKEDWGGNEAKNKPANQPEKYLIHLLGDYNKGKINKDDLLPKITDLMQTIETNGRQDKLLEYLKQKNIQAKVGHFTDETRDILAKLVLGKVPESEREQYLARDFMKNRKLSKNIPDEQKAEAVSQNMLYVKANTLPKEQNLTAAERLAHMPTALKRDFQRQAQRT